MLKENLEVYYKRKCTNLDIFIGFLKVSGFRAAVLYRIGHFLFNKKRYFLAALVTRMIRATCNMDIELSAIIGRRVKFPHPFAIVIGGNVRIGDDCVVMQCVTLGGNQGKSDENIGTQPYLEDKVFVGPGAKLLGPIRIGNRVKIGANSVVLKSVPEDSIATGVPAIIKPLKLTRSD